jgi:hypothetical protein
MALAADECLAGLSLRIKKVEGLFKSFLRGFAGRWRNALRPLVPGSSGLLACAFRPVAVEAQEPRSRPAGAGDQASDLQKTLIATTFVFVALGFDIDQVHFITPLTTSRVPGLRVGFDESE